MIVRSPARQGTRGSLATDGVVRRRRNTWPGRQWSRWKSEVLMWLKGHGGSTFTLWLASPAEGCPGRTTMTRYWSPLSAGHRHGWWACCVGGAGRGLRHVGVRGGEWVPGPSRGTCTGVEVRKVKRGELAQWNDTGSVPQGVGRADARAVVTVCDEPLARGGGARHTIRAVWFGANGVCRRAFRDGQVCCWSAGGLRGCHGVVTSGAKHGGGRYVRRFLHVSGKGGTGWDG